MSFGAQFVREYCSDENGQCSYREDQPNRSVYFVFVTSPSREEMPAIDRAGDSPDSILAG
jgi:hypothetical protein